MSFIWHYSWLIPYVLTHRVLSERHNRGRREKIALRRPPETGNSLLIGALAVRKGAERGLGDAIGASPKVYFCLATTE